MLVQFHSCSSHHVPCKGPAFFLHASTLWMCASVTPPNYHATTCSNSFFATSSSCSQSRSLVRPLASGRFFAPTLFLPFFTPVASSCSHGSYDSSSLVRLLPLLVCTALLHVCRCFSDVIVPTLTSSMHSACDVSSLLQRCPLFSCVLFKLFQQVSDNCLLALFILIHENHILHHSLIYIFAGF